MAMLKHEVSSLPVAEVVQVLQKVLNRAFPKNTELEAGAENPSQRVPIWYTFGDGCAADASGDRRMPRVRVTMSPRVACLMVASSSDILPRNVDEG
jgi:hypothetical protein